MVNWKNTYANTSGHWFKGSLHTHCIPESPCATIDLYTLLSGYINKGFDFLSISDHLAVTFPECHDLNLIPGMEWNSRAGLMPKTVQTQHDHIGLYHVDGEALVETLHHRTLPELFEQTSRTMLCIANHPDWLPDEHFDLNTLIRFSSNIDGIEIYNYSLEEDVGQADTTWKWDRLLSMGYPLLGFASDDSHFSKDIGQAWLMVRAQNNTSSDILHSLKSGNFYCTTGITFKTLERHNSTLYAECEEEVSFRVIGSFGRLLTQTVGKEIEYQFPQDQTKYARFHALNKNWQQCWSQPFYRD